MDLANNYVIVVGNGFLGNRVAWRIQKTKVFHVGHRHLEASIDRLPPATYTVVWCHGICRGSAAEIEDSQLGFMARAIRLLKDSAAQVVRHILLSSSHAYLDTPYGYVKRLCEEAILQESRTSQVHVSVIRVPNVYGVTASAKPDSIISKWLCENSPICADYKAEIKYVSVDQVADTVISNLEAEGTAIIDISPEMSLPVKLVGAEIAKVRGLPFKLADFGQISRAGASPSARTSEARVASLDLKSIPALVRGCEFARGLKARVQQSQRSHNGTYAARILSDLDTGDLDSGNRVSMLNVAAGTKRGDRYRRAQTEIFEVTKGTCELQIKTESGVTTSVSLSAGQKIKVYPGEDCTFWSPREDCQILTLSDMTDTQSTLPDICTYT